MILDTRTLILYTAVITFVMMMAMLLTWRISREQRSGMFWTLAMLGECCGLVIYGFTPAGAPDWVSPLANIPIALGGYFLLLGLRSFRGAPLRVGLNGLLPVYYSVGILYFLFVEIELACRIFVASTYQILMGALYVREALLVRRRGLVGGAASVAAGLCGLHALYFCARLIAALEFDPVQDFMAPHPWQTYTFFESGIFVLCIGVALMAMTVDNLYLQLRMTALRDQTTGLLSRNALLERLTEEIGAAHAANQPLHLLMIDLDHLDRVNETYGHKAGDAMLAAFGSMLRNDFELADTSGRYGGDEFALVLADRNTAEATNLAHKIRRAMEALVLPLENGRVSLTVSIGLTRLQYQDRQFDGLIARAASALSRAKQGGRNRVVVL